MRWLVAQGHTVFCLSWKNPTPADRELGMDDYVRLGIEEPLAAVCSIVPDVPVQTVGYCIGGTLLAIGAALLAGRGDMRIGSLTLFAAQTDFSEPGELSLFIRPGQLAVLEAMMAQRGVLESHQMAAAFQWLRPQDLIFQPAVNTYLRGQREPMVDLMAWNADGTRMPARMHGEYLRRLYLENQLANDRYTVGDQVLHLTDIRVPAFLVGTEADHVAPWRSVYKAHRGRVPPDAGGMAGAGAGAGRQLVAALGALAGSARRGDGEAAEDGQCGLSGGGGRAGPLRPRSLALHPQHAVAVHLRGKA